MDDIGQFLKDYGGHVLGFLGLAQLWLIALWRRFITRGKLAVYEMGLIEIGFSLFGPTVCLLGTLRALRRDVFVKRMRVRIIRRVDKAEHTFTWRAFRPLVMTLTPGAPQSLAVAGSFLVPMAAPRQYNVFFASPAFANYGSSDIQPLRDSWTDFSKENITENPAVSTELFNRFMQCETASRFRVEVLNEFFWHASEYDLELTIETDNVKHPATKHWKFALTREDEERLRMNIDTVIRELCELKAAYNFLSKEYEEVRPG